MRKLIATLLLATGCAVAPGQQPFKELGTLVDAATMDAAINFTITGDKLAGYSTLVLYNDHSTNSTATSISWLCEASDDGGSTYFPLQSATVASGVGTLDDATFAKTVAAADTWVFRVDISGMNQGIKCTLTENGDGSDVITVTGTLAAK